MMVSAKKFNFKKVLIIIISVLLAFCVISMVVTKIIYDRVFVRYDTPAEVPAALTDMVDSRHTCQFYSGENQLTGYYYGLQDPQQAHGLVVLVPGFCAGGDDYLWQIRELLDYGWGVFTFDSTGTLNSQGKNQVGFPQAVPDLEAALKYVEKNGRFGYNELVLIGHSRGAYAACCVLGQDWDVSAVVSISGVNSAMEAVMQMSTNMVGPISYGNYGFLWLYQAMLFGKDTVNLQAAQVLSQEDVPVLVVHGSEDAQFPTDASSIISYKEQIESAQVTYLVCDAGHTDIMYDADGTANDALMEKIHAFLIQNTEEK